MPIQLEQVVIPGSELEAIPLEDDALPLVLSIDQVWPHGSQFRYDFRFYGLEAGSYQLKDYLRRKDGSSMEDVPPLPVLIESTLPPGQFEPGALNSNKLPETGGYRQWMTVAVCIWVAGLLAILWSMRRGRNTPQTGSQEPSAPTLAERLTPLVQAAATGNLSKDQQAALERLLLAYWTEHLQLEPGRPAERIQALKAHPEAGPLIRALETWLHHPNAEKAPEIDHLLKPYRDVTWTEESSATNPEPT